MTGESGSGKSALIARWWMLRRNLTQISTKPIFVHFAGASAYASTLLSIIKRLFLEINSVLYAHKKPRLSVPSTIIDLIDAIPQFFAAMSKIVIF